MATKIFNRGKTVLKPRNIYEKSREHLANERTFLAWVRTGIALMGFGFVIVKFTLFLKEVKSMLDAEGLSSEDYSGIVGVIMVALGVLISVLAFIQFKKYDRQLHNNYYVSSTMLSTIMTLIIFIGGIVLILYLLAII